MDYASREDARNDLLLAGVVFAFGPFVFQLLLSLVGIGRPGALLAIILTLVTTVLVPVLLMRYRGENLAMLGIGGSDRSVPIGLLGAVPLVVVSALLLPLTGPVQGLVGAHPLQLVLGGAIFHLVLRLVAWGGMLLLALYITVKARDAFGGDPQRVEDVVGRIVRVLAIAVGASALLVAAIHLGADAPLGAYLALVAWPAAVAAGVWLIFKRTAGVATTSLPVLVAPTIIGALGNFVLNLFQPTELIVSVYYAGLSGAIGLGAGLLAERTRRGGGVVVLALLIALATSLPIPLRLFGG